MRLFPVLSITFILHGWAFANEVPKTHSVDYFLQKSDIKKTQFNPFNAKNGKLLVTNLDEHRGSFLRLRKLFLSDLKNAEYLYKYNWRLGKIQRPRSQNEFPCPLNNTRSSVTPSSVDEIRPGDIDVVAAIGDSLSAGNGALSEMPWDIIKEFRSITFSGGGQADWRTVLTLPNILKVFNPNLYGYATADVVAADRRAYLNIAEPMVMSRDLEFQVRILIERMRLDPRIDMAKHWKLLTIFVGNNDICTDICHHDNLWDFLKKHATDLKTAFTLLRDNVPRLLVNLIPVPDMGILRGMRTHSFQCAAVHYAACHCIIGEHHHSAGELKILSEFILRWQHIDAHVASLAEFQTQDFAVLFQPITINISLPILANGDADLRFFASDCFHFSQLGHAAVANNLWNNMLQAPHAKITFGLDQPFKNFECPTEERPFIATLNNS